MALTKHHAAEQVQSELGFPKKQAIEVVESLLEIIKSTLESGEDVLISGFGKFSVRHKRERMGRNPATGQEMILRPRGVVTFRCSGRLREKINAKQDSLEMNPTPDRRGGHDKE